MSSINGAIKQAIEHYGGQAKFNQILEYIKERDPVIKPQSIRFALYYGTVGSGTRQPIFKRIKRGVYSAI
jgi:hypothetical protein